MILKLELGATDLGSELGAKICGSEVPATSSPCIYAATLYVSNYLGAKICDAEMCNLGATSSDADPLGPNMSLSSRGG
jgi:hypothetical protein